MMNSGKWISTTMCIALGTALYLTSASAQADDLNAKLLPLSNGDMALIMEHDGLVLSGQGAPEQDYLYIDLMHQSYGSKSVNSTETREGSAGTGQPFLARWGHAELMLSCGTQQIILYQEIEGNDQEVLVASFDAISEQC